MTRGASHQTTSNIKRVYKISLILFVAISLFPQMLSAQAWYNTSWLYRKMITVDYTKVGTGPHTNYPMLINTTDTDLQARALSSGNDILFTSSDGVTKLSHEIESYTSGTGALVAWVEIPSLSSAANTVIYMYYGNASATSQQNINGTWDSNFKGVWHLNSAFTDATSNANNGTNTGTVSATGKISGGRGYVRSNGADYITVTGLMGSPANVTVSAWATLTTRDATGAHIVNMGDYVSLGMDDVSSGTMGAYQNASNVWTLTKPATAANYAGTGWHYLVYTIDDSGNSQVLYVDGVSKATSAISNSILYSGLGSNTIIGKHANGSANYDFDGTIDEVRISNTVRSAGWILTDYNNQNSPSTFYSVGSEAKQYYSLTNGNSNAASTWSNTGHAGAVSSTTPGGVSGDYIVIGNNNTVTLSANIVTQTAVVINSTGTLDLGTNTISGSGTFTLNSGATLKIGSTAGITSSGATGNVQVTGTRTFSTGANYVYNGTSPQSTGNGLPSTINDLTISNSAGVTLTSAITSSDDITISSGTLTANNLNITLSGNWSNSGTFTAGTGTVTFSGGNAQTISHAGSGNFYNLTINKSANDISLNNTITATHTFTLTARSLQLGTNNLTIGASASIAGGSSSSFIVTNSTGTLIQNNIGSGGRTGSILFPVGTSTTSYTPITVNNTGIADAFNVRVFDNVFMQGTSGTTVSSHIVKKTWMVSESVVGGSNVTLTAQWNTADEGTSFLRSSCGISHYVSSAWDSPSFTAASGSNPYSISRSGITSFSPFAVEENTTPLPITLLYFNLKQENGKNNLIWATASEKNNRGFQIEKSTDGKTFTSIGFVDGQGNSKTKIDYNFADTETSSTAAYYRLKQVDWDDQYEYSRVVYASSPLSTVSISIYPNPVAESITIQGNETLNQEATVALKVYADSGELILFCTGTLTQANERLNEALERLNTGVYVIKINSQSQDYQQKFIKL